MGHGSCFHRCRSVCSRRLANRCYQWSLYMDELFGPPWRRPFAILGTCLMICLLLTAWPRTATGQSAAPLAAQAEAADPAVPPPVPEPNPDCVPINCGGGVVACSCSVCCPNSVQPCYELTVSSIVRTALNGGCSLAPGNSCASCPKSDPPSHNPGTVGAPALRFASGLPRRD